MQITRVKILFIEPTDWAREKLRWRSEQCDWKWSFRFRDSFGAVEGLIILISPWSRALVFDIRESLCVRSSRTSNRIQQFCTLDIVHSLSIIEPELGASVKTN